MALWALGKLGFKRNASSGEILRITSAIAKGLALFIPYLRASKIIALIPNETIEKNVERLLFVETNRMGARRISIALLPKRVIQGMVMSNTQFDHVPFTHCINDRSSTSPIPFLNCLKPRLLSPLIVSTRKAPEFPYTSDSPPHCRQPGNNVGEVITLYHDIGNLIEFGR